MFLDDLDAEHRSNILLKGGEECNDFFIIVRSKVNLFVECLRMVGK